VEMRRSISSTGGGFEQEIRRSGDQEIRRLVSLFSGAQ